MKKIFVKDPVVTRRASQFENISQFEIWGFQIGNADLRWTMDQIDEQKFIFEFAWQHAA